MKFQSRNYLCGPATIHNAAYALGVKCPSQLKIARDCGTTLQGTDEEEMLRAAMQVGLSPDSMSWYDSDHFMAWVDESLASGRVIALCMDEWEHWCLLTSCVGPNTKTKRYIVFDPSNTKANIESSGVRMYSQKGLITRTAKRHQKPSHVFGIASHVFYGIALAKAPK